MKKVISALLLGAMLTACSPAAPAGSQTKEVTVKGNERRTQGQSHGYR